MDTGPYGGYGVPPGFPGFPGQGAQKGGNTMIMIVLFVIILAAGAAYYFFVMNQEDSTPDSDTSDTTPDSNVTTDADTEDAGVSADELQAEIGTPPPEPGADESVTQDTIAAPPAGVDCEGEWGNWSECSKPCDGGTKSRTYTVTTPASGDGQACPRQDGEVEEVACNEQGCPVDCVGEWTAWSECSENCGTGSRKRTYNIIRKAENGGKVCEVDNQRMEDGYEQSEPCNNDPCPVACVGQWSQWSGCNKTCGGGTQERFYSHTTPAAHGGQACPASNGQREEQECNTHPCPVNCQGAWTAWEECPRGAQGYRKRTYKVSTQADHGGTACPVAHDTIEGEYCNQGTEYWMSVADSGTGVNQVGGVEILGPKGAQAIPGVLEFKAKWRHFGWACGTWSNRSCTTGVKMYINDQERAMIYRVGKDGASPSSNWYRIKGVKSGDIIKAIEEGDRTNDAGFAWKFHPNDTTDHPESIYQKID